MKILMASSELAPLAVTGRLGETVAALSGALTEAGHEVSVVMPYYRMIRERCGLEVQNSGVQLTLSVGSRRLQAVVYEAELENGVQLFLIGREEFFDRSGIYGAEEGGYSDNAERFIFFSRAVVELARHLSPAPDVIHLHDWQSALAAVFVREARLPFRTVLSLYDVAYQGIFPGHDFDLTNLPRHLFNSEGVEFHGQLNCLKGGVLYADALVATSARYAEAIQSPEEGHGLDGAFRLRAARLCGISPGLDRELWNPATDRRIAATYSVTKLGGKAQCRTYLHREMGLKPHPSAPTLAFFHYPATTGQVLDLLVPILDRLLVDDMRVILVGERDPRFERELRVAARQYPGKFAYRTEMGEALCHEIMAGADLLLLSSHPDPAGEVGQIALAYGTLPVVRSAGGVHQVVQDYEPAGLGNGFVYHRDSSEALYDAVVRARRLFMEPERWNSLVARAMEKDSSWAASAQRFVRVYEGRAE